MKRIFPFFIGGIALALSSCGTVQQAQLNSGVQQAQTEIANKCSLLTSLSSEEAAAWDTSKDAMKQCFDGVPEPWPKDQKTQAAFQCGTEYLNEHIKPLSYSQENFGQFMNGRAEQERAYMEGKLDWAAVGQKAQERIARYFQGGKAGSYFDYANCQNAVIQQTVMPTYSPQLRPLLVEWMAETSAFSRQADKDKLSPPDYQVGMQNLWSAFIGKEQQTINSYNAQNAQAWQNYSQDLRQLSNQVMQAESARQQTMPAPSMPVAAPPVQTHCMTFGNQTNCSTQ